MENSAPIGVFDSGIGGLTVVKELLRLLPEENFIYFGDTARTPYGSRSPVEILRFMHQILRFFADQQVKQVVVACNTMTALGCEEARKQYPFLVVGTNTGIRSALTATHNKSIGVIATQGTISSGNHRKAIEMIDPHATIYPLACPQFVPLIEGEQMDSLELKEAAEKYLLPLQEAAVDTIILACTHYPFITPLLQSIMGQGVQFIDPARDTAIDVRNMLLREKKLKTDGAGSCKLCFSADLDRARRLAKHILYERVSDFQKVDLTPYY